MNRRTKGGVTLSLFSTLWVADRGANSLLKGKLAGKARLTLTFSLAILFSTLPAIHSSSVAVLISYGEVVRRSQDVTRWEERGAQQLPPSRLDVNWMAASVSALPAKRFTSVTGLHSISLSGHLPSAPECEPLKEWQCDTSLSTSFPCGKGC